MHFYFSYKIQGVNHNRVPVCHDTSCPMYLLVLGNSNGQGLAVKAALFCYKERKWPTERSKRVLHVKIQFSNSE